MKEGERGGKGRKVGEGRRIMSKEGRRETVEEEDRREKQFQFTHLI